MAGQEFGAGLGGNGACLGRDLGAHVDDRTISATRLAQRSGRGVGAVIVGENSDLFARAARRTRRRSVAAAEASMTPGRSLPGKTNGRSNAPVASTTDFRADGPVAVAWLALGRHGLVVGDALQCGKRVVVVVAPHGRARQKPHIVARREFANASAAHSAAGMPPIVSADQLAEPPKRGSSSARMTRAPVSAAAVAAMIPAGPEPTTSTSQKAFMRS